MRIFFHTIVSRFFLLLQRMGERFAQCFPKSNVLFDQRLILSVVIGIRPKRRSGRLRMGNRFFSKIVKNADRFACDQRAAPTAKFRALQANMARRERPPSSDSRRRCVHHHQSPASQLTKSGNESRKMRR